MNASIVELGDVCSFQRGLTYSKADEADEPGQVVLRANNVDLFRHGLDFKDLKYIRSTFEIPEAKKIRAGSLLICTASGSKNHLGKVAYVDQDYGYAFGGFMGQITPRGVSGKYLYYVLTSPDYEQFIGRLSGGLNINNLKFDELRRFTFQCPSLDEQRRIVAVLDQAFEAIGVATLNAERNLAKSGELFDTFLDSICTTQTKRWTQRPLGDEGLLEIIDGDRGTHYPNKRDFKSSGYCLFLNTKNVRPDGFNFDETMFVSKEKDAALRKGKLMRNDVVLTTRGTIGNVAVYDQSVPYENVRINSGMLIFRPRRDVIRPKYLFEVFRSSGMKRQIGRYATGAAQPQLPIRTLVNFTIPVPERLADQDRIVERLDHMSSQISDLGATYRLKLDRLRELRRSIFREAFAGNLTSLRPSPLYTAAE